LGYFKKIGLVSKISGLGYFGLGRWGFLKTYPNKNIVKKGLVSKKAQSGYLGIS
jgi:hypothetical protein